MSAPTPRVDGSQQRFSHLPARRRLWGVGTGVPRAVVEQRMQRGQLIGGPQARVPLYVPYADFFQYQAGAGRLADRA